jgi:hypothetical protein
VQAACIRNNWLSVLSACDCRQPSLMQGSGFCGAKQVASVTIGRVPGRTDLVKAPLSSATFLIDKRVRCRNLELIPNSRSSNAPT